jgi:hypothetical protein
VGAEVRKILMEDKKAALIKKRYTDKTTLEALSEEENLTVETASAVNQKNPTIVGAGNEPNVVGTAFAMNEGELSDLVQGDKGVYKILLNQKNIVEDLEDYSAYSKEIQRNASFTLIENVFVALESVAEIEDNRALYY